MSKSGSNGKYCLINPNDKKAGCDDKNEPITKNCTKVKDTTITYYSTPTSSSDNQIINIARDPTIDYNYFRAGR